MEKKVVCCPSLDSVPEAVHDSERRGVGVRRSALYVSMGRRRPLAMRWQKQGLMPPLGRIDTCEGEDGLG